VLDRGTSPLDAATFEAVANETGALILDTRAPQTFRKAFIPNSINIGIDGSFAPWAGALIPGVGHPILIVADEGREKEVVTRLARVGFDNTLGYLKGGFKSWLQADRDIESIDSISAEELEKRAKGRDLLILDVRKPTEFTQEHLEDARPAPLDFLNDHLSDIPREGEVYLHCAGGYRSMIAASILKARGWNNIIDIDGGMKAIKQTGLKRVGSDIPGDGKD
jgi:rhodanese-related sulfurtransferase